MYIFHLAKGQENLNSRSKMAHLPLSIEITIRKSEFKHKTLIRLMIYI